jgi:hypothetical protein
MYVRRVCANGVFVQIVTTSMQIMTNESHVGRHFARCTQSAGDCRRRFRFPARCFRKGSEPLPAGLWRYKSSAWHPGRAGGYFRGGAMRGVSPMRRSIDGAAEDVLFWGRDCLGRRCLPFGRPRCINGHTKSGTTFVGRSLQRQELRLLANARHEERNGSLPACATIAWMELPLVQRGRGTN